MPLATLYGVCLVAILPFQPMTRDEDEHPSLVIIKAFADLEGGVLRVFGRNFGERPRAWLSGQRLEILESTDTEIEARLPPDVEAGTYRLVVERRKREGTEPGLRKSMDLTIGAVGPQGEAGQPGQPGPPGPPLSSFESLAGLACTVGGVQGVLQISYSPSGIATLTCLSGPPGPPSCVDADLDGFFFQQGCGTPVDCDDSDPTVHPGAPEVCGDGKDNDCSGGDQAGPPLALGGDRCDDAVLVTGPDFGPSSVSGDMASYDADVAGSCGSAGDDLLYRVDVPSQGGLTTFATILMDASGSAIDTALHLTTTCGDPAGEPVYASQVCGASSGAGRACANVAGTTEALRACGMPSSNTFAGQPYYATVDSTASQGVWALNLHVDSVDLDTCAQSGNVSNLPSNPTTYANLTTGKANNYRYDATSSSLACPGPPTNSNACGEANGDPSGGGPVCNSDGGASSGDIVFYYYATSTGFLTADTQGSTYDTVLYIKSGCNLDCFPPSDCRRCNDDHNLTAGASWSRVYHFCVTVGNLYYMVVDGYGGASGTAQLNLSFEAGACVTPPPQFRSHLK